MHTQLHRTVINLEREFVCAACGERRRAMVTGIGEGTESMLNSDGTGERRAQVDAERDVDATLAIAACTACGVRDEKAIRRWWWKKAVAPMLIVCGLVTGVGLFVSLQGDSEDEERWVAMAVCGGLVLLVLAVVLPLVVWPKWSSAASRVKWL